MREGWPLFVQADSHSRDSDRALPHMPTGMSGTLTIHCTEGVPTQGRLLASYSGEGGATFIHRTRIIISG